jgi:pimeloyl-ACP methyl ester carboxylesterase
VRKLLLLHGALGCENQLDLLSEALQHEGLSVLTMNFSGHGGKPFIENFGIETFSAEVIRFMDGHNISVADVFGYSMGGYVALWCALNNPARFGTIATLGTKFDWTIESAERETRKMIPEKILEKVPAFARLLESRHKPNDWKLLMQATSLMMTELGHRPMLTIENVSAIRSEVHIVLGDRDDMADRKFSQSISTAIPRGSFTVLPDIPHAIEKVSLTTLMPVLQEIFLR